MFELKVSLNFKFCLHVKNDIQAAYSYMIFYMNDCHFSLKFESYVKTVKKSIILPYQRVFRDLE